MNNKYQVVPQPAALKKPPKAEVSHTEFRQCRGASYLTIESC